MKITVVGTGYVGLSNAILFAQNNEVKALEIIEEKVHLINQKKSPIVDREIEEYLATKELNLTATTDKSEAYKDSEFVVIATPTNYDEKKNFFNTSSVESVIEDVLEYRPEATMIIKSTVPVGYTKEIKEKYRVDNIIFSPEFLREGYSVEDMKSPDRTVIGSDSQRALDQARMKKFAGQCIGLENRFPFFFLLSFSFCPFIFRHRYVQFLRQQRFERRIGRAGIKHHRHHGQRTLRVLMHEMRFHREMAAFKCVLAGRMEMKLRQSKGLAANAHKLAATLRRGLQSVAVVFHAITRRLIMKGHAALCSGGRPAQIHRRLVFAGAALGIFTAQSTPMRRAFCACIRPMRRMRRIVRLSSRHR